MSSLATLCRSSELCTVGVNRPNRTDARRRFSTVLARSTRRLDMSPPTNANDLSSQTHDAVRAREELSKWFTKIVTRAPAPAPPAPAFDDAQSSSKTDARIAARAMDDLGSSLKIISRSQCDGGVRASERASDIRAFGTSDETLYHARATTRDIELFDTRTSGVPRRFAHDDEMCDVTKALEALLRSMSVNERVVARCAWSATYGDASATARALARDSRLVIGDEITYDVEVVGRNRVTVVRVRDGREGEGGAVRLTRGGYARGAKTILTSGRGWETPRPPFEVTIEYSAYVVRGNKRNGDDDDDTASDAEFVKKTEVSFASGDGRAPLAMDCALRTMRLGEEALIWTNYGGFGTTAALGSKYARVIPALPSDGTEAADGVVYKVKLVAMRQVRDVFNDGSTTKTRLVEGQGEFPADCPMQDCTVRVHFALSTSTSSLGTSNMVVRYDTRTDAALAGQPFEFRLGCGAVPEALETSIRLMIPKEKSRVVLDFTRGEKARKRGYGAQNCRDDAPGAKFCTESSLALAQWDVELESFDTAVNWYKADIRDMLDEALVMKEEANALFKTEVYELARSKYEKTLSKLESLRGLDQEDFESVDTMKTTIALNLVATLQRLKDHVGALKRVNKILESHPENAKALFRRSVSFLAQHEFSAARDDLFACLDSNPSLQSTIAKQLELIKRAEAQSAAQDKANFGGKL